MSQLTLVFTAYLEMVGSFMASNLESILIVLDLNLCAAKEALTGSCMATPNKFQTRMFTYPLLFIECTSFIICNPHMHEGQVCRQALHSFLC